MRTSQKLFLLDTNIASLYIRSEQLDARIQRISIESLCISAVTEGELFYGLAKKPLATKLHKLVEAFLLRIAVLPWNSEAARAYGTLRARCDSKGISIGNLDMLIAAHALATGATLVTRDKALLQVRPWINVENWAD